MIAAVDPFEQPDCETDALGPDEGECGACGAVTRFRERRGGPWYCGCEDDEDFGEMPARDWGDL